jgi:hypothetical protein
VDCGKCLTISCVNKQKGWVFSKHAKVGGVSACLPAWVHVSALPNETSFTFGFQFSGVSRE